MSKQASEKLQKKAQLGRAITAEDLGIDEKNVEVVSPVTFSNWVRTLSQNWRQGTVACKGRSDVARSNKKPWKQKGTGRARAGSARSPLWRGGGVIFGPQARTRTLDISKASKRGVLRTLLLGYLQGERVQVLDWAPEGDTPKTSLFYAALKGAGLHDQKVVMFLPINDFLSQASCMNIPNVNVLFFDQANAFDLANSSHWVYLQRDAGAFKDMVARWI
jgi:large subunit ribosomal protein L4